MLARNWEHQWLPLCPAKLSRIIRIVGVVHPIKSNQNLRVFWKPVNPQECVWEKSLPTHHEDHIAGKGDKSLQHKNWITNLSYASSHENPRSKGSSGQGMGKTWRKFRRGT